MRVLVTGGAGVIGSGIVHRLADAGHSVSIIDSCDEKRNDWIAARRPEKSWLFRERIERHPGLVEEQVRQSDAVIHCAASTGIPYSVGAPDDDWQRNVEATRVLLNALRDYPRPTVMLSSVKPYTVPPDIETRGGLTEDDPLIPDEPYAASKATQSMLAMSYARSYGVPVVTFRCSNLYAAAPPWGNRHGWLTNFCVRAAMGMNLTVEGDGSQSRDMLHGDDVYSACMLALDNAQRLRGRVFNLGGGKYNRISVGEAASQLAAMGGVDVVHAPARAMDDLHVFVNGAAWLKETGWHPRIDVRDGMRSVFEWAKANADELRELYK